MWECTNCGRIFQKTKQVHSCNKFPLEQHFKNKEKARKLFKYLFEQIDKSIGKCKIISLPCCIHLFGTYDFLAALPKKDGLEIRFSLNRVLDSPRLKQSVPVSSKYYKNCIDVKNLKEIDGELITWVSEAYRLKNG